MKCQKLIVSPIILIEEVHFYLFERFCILLMSCVYVRVFVSLFCFVVVCISVYVFYTIWDFMISNYVILYCMMLYDII